MTNWGTGGATRDLLHARDAAEGILAMLVRVLDPARPLPGPVNLGSGVERTTREIAEAVATAVGWHGTLHWDTTKPDGMARKVLDTSRAGAELGWTARIPLDEGLEETVAWYRSCS